MTATCTLTVTSGPAAGTAIEVERELVLGREGADLTIPDEELSRRHAILRPTEGGVVVEDLGSLNGTFVNGERISGPVTLTADAAIRIGRSELDMQLAALAAAPEPVEPEEDPGRTRLANVVAPPQQPTPEPPDPQMTRIRRAPDAPDPDQPQDQMPQIEATRVRPSVQPPVDPAFAHIQATRVRPAAQQPAAPAPGASSDAPAGSEPAKRPGPLARLLARLRGGGKGGDS